jgi:uncharacterized protein YciU (UPF0263 family)
LALERVIIGKLALKDERGELSVFALPEDFAWLKHFSANHLAEFFAEMLDALLQGQHTGDWSPLVEVVESWRATASIEAQPDTVAEIAQGLRELEAGQGVSWEALRRELEL